MSTDIAGDERWEFMSVTDSGCALVPALLFAGGATGAGALHAVPLLIPPRGTAGRVWWALLPSSVYLSAYLLYLATTRTTRAAASERTWRLEDRPGMLRLLVDRAVRAYAPVAFLGGLAMSATCWEWLVAYVALDYASCWLGLYAALWCQTRPPSGRHRARLTSPTRHRWLLLTLNGAHGLRTCLTEYLPLMAHLHWSLCLPRGIEVAHATTADRMSAETHLCRQPWWSRWTCLVVAAHIVWNVVRLAVGAAYLLSVPSREK
ncbi:hypothetical protein CDCA_CDCA01G0057 [Cyanidium caldarium]|uniref:Uncharacterized protein n=1 Tax=Cyanidium caldarium TaxID=2771 RepID=A0AAV9IP52_CYACA|nr:hypothetical protein CDCA_CDCA01G0057 [Cyanidium caldarium]